MFNENNKQMLELIEEITPKVLSDKLNLSNKYIVKGFSELDELDNVPTICMFNKKITASRESRYYISYLFKEDMSGFYLTFRWGSSAFDIYDDKSNVRKKVSEDLRNLIRVSFDDFKFESSVDLPSKYSDNIIISRYYSLKNLPTDKLLIKDFKDFEKIYRFVIDDFYEMSFLDSDEWKFILESGMLEPFMIDILKIIYEFEGHTSTPYEICDVRKSLGFDDGHCPNVYSWEYIDNGEKISRYFKRYMKATVGTTTYWAWFFYKANLGKKYRYILKDELVEALKEIYPELKVYRKHKYSLTNEKQEVNNLNSWFKLNDEKVVEEEIKINTDYSFYNYLLDNDYYFNKEIIENYLLSLKVKPFAILTGNSGTGKTKLSQLFAKYISDSTTLDNFSQKVDNEYIHIKVKSNYSSWANVGWGLSSDYFKSIFPIELLESKYDIEIDGIKNRATISANPQLYYDENNEELKSHFNKLFDEDKDQTVDLYIKSKDLKELCPTDYDEVNGDIILTQNSNKSAFTKRQWLLNQEFFRYIPFKKGYVPCEICVDGIKSDAKIRFVPKLRFDKNSRLEHYLKENNGKQVSLKIKFNNSIFKQFKSNWNINDVESINEEDNLVEEINYKIVPVGANWTENRNIVGYYNLITEKYQSTPAYELIKQSNRNLDSPHFLILDEMNLSHVERYFADFLSAIESGEDIPLYGIDDDLEIPDNLFIIGTVNVDETTYMFSPKVLDRANVLEFETYSSKDYMLGNINLDAPNGNIGYLENPLSDLDIKNLGINELNEVFNGVKVQNEDFWDLLSDEIFEFQKILKKSGFDFGFRVINEIVRFMVVAWRYEGKPTEWTNWERYFDAQIKQKMLPKLHGSEKILGDTLTDLAKACVDGERVKYYTSAKKLDEMMKVLDKQRYVSFIN